MYAKCIAKSKKSYCAGLILSHNYFKNNAVFFRPGGIMKMACFILIKLTSMNEYLAIDDLPFEFDNIRTKPYVESFD